MYIRYTSWVTHAIKCITITVFKHLLMFQQHAPEFHYPHFIITNAFVCLHVSSINVTLETCLTLRIYLQNPNSRLFHYFQRTNPHLADFQSPLVIVRGTSPWTIQVSWFLYVTFSIYLYSTTFTTDTNMVLLEISE